MIYSYTSCTSLITRSQLPPQIFSMSAAAKPRRRSSRVTLRSCDAEEQPTTLPSPSKSVPFLRTLVFQIAAVMLLPLVWGIDGIWWSIVVAEAMAVIVGGIFLITKQKKYQY